MDVKSAALERDRDRFHELMRASQQRAAEREAAQRERLNEMEEANRRESAASLEAARKERMDMEERKNKLDKERICAMEAVRAGTREEREKIMKEREEERQRVQEEKKKLHDQTIQKETQQREEMLKMKKEHTQNVRRHFESIMEADRENHNARMKIMEGRMQMQIAGVYLKGEITRISAIEKDANEVEKLIGVARKSTGNIEEAISGLINVMLQNGIEKDEKREAQQRFLKCVSDEAARVSLTMDSVRRELDRSSIDLHKRNNAKVATSSIRSKTVEVETEVTTLRFNMQQKYILECAHLVVLRRNVEDLRKSLDDFPPLITQTLNGFIHNEIQNVHLASTNNAALTRGKQQAAIEEK